MEEVEEEIEFVKYQVVNKSFGISSSYVPFLRKFNGHKTKGRISILKESRKSLFDRIILVFVFLFAVKLNKHKIRRT